MGMSNMGKWNIYLDKIWLTLIWGVTFVAPILFVFYEICAIIRTCTLPICGTNLMLHLKHLGNATFFLSFTNGCCHFLSFPIFSMLAGHLKVRIFWRYFYTSLELHSIKINLLYHEVISSKLPISRRLVDYGRVAKLQRPWVLEKQRMFVGKIPYTAYCMVLNVTFSLELAVDKMTCFWCFVVGNLIHFKWQIYILQRQYSLLQVSEKGRVWSCRPGVEGILYWRHHKT